MPIHHIIPRYEWLNRFGTLKGLNAKDNLIELTIEQHAQVHAHYYKEITHHEYDRIASLYISSLINKQEALSQALIIRNKSRKGEKRTPEWCAWISSTHKGKAKSHEHRLKISLSKTGTRLNEEWKRKISTTMTGRIRGPYKPETKPRKPYKQRLNRSSFSV